MKTIGLIGGMSWESTLGYYRIMNEGIKEALGGYHSAKILMYSVDFAEVEACLSTNDWEKSAQLMIDAAKRLENAGADCILIGTNTLHKVADEVQNHLNVPLIHIASVTADALRKDGIQKTALLGTRFTLEQDFFTTKLKERGIEVLIPSENDRAIINNVIFGELCLGEISERSKKEFLRIVEELAKLGAQAAILGCTEIGMLIGQNDTKVPLYDTTVVHAKSAVAFALQE